MKKHLRIFGSFLVLALLISVMAGCSPQGTTKPTGSTTAATTVATTAKIDISKAVTLKLVTIASPVPDKDKVLAEINKLLKVDLNATLDIGIIDWGNWETDYKLMLAAQEPVDIIYSSSWTNLIDNSSKGAFNDITDSIAKYAPKWYDKYKNDWENLKINGKIYQLPNPDQANAVNVNGMSYREDLRKKYNVPEIKQFTDFEAYFDAIKANEPTLTPFKVSSGDYWVLFLDYLIEKTGFQDMGLGVNFLAYDISDPTYKVYNLLETDAMQSFVDLMKKWSDKGFWDKGALANKVKSGDSFMQGVSASCMADFDDYLRYKGDTENIAKNPTWEIGWYYPVRNGKVQQTDLTSNGVCFPSSGKNLDRALALADLLAFDDRYYKLGAYGIKDVHYTVNADGSITSKFSADANPYTTNAIWGMPFYNSSLIYPVAPPSTDLQKALLAETKVLENQLRTNQYPNKIMTFAPDLADIKTAQAALSELWNSTMPVFSLGLSPDTAQSLADAKAQAKLAGIEDARAKLQTQIDAYLAANK